MNKTDLINSVSEKTGSTKVDAKSHIEALLAVISDALASEERITLAGFGAFYVADKASRHGINPRTKEEIFIPGHKSVKFRAAPELLDTLRIPDSEKL